MPPWSKGFAGNTRLNQQMLYSRNGRENDTSVSALVLRLLGAISFRRGPRVEDGARALRNRVERIPESIRKAELQYRAVSENLGQLGSAARQISNRSASLAELADGQSHALAHIEMGSTLIEAFFSRIADLQATLGNLIRDVREAGDCIRQLQRGERNLADAIAPLEYVQVMLKIEAARLPAGHQEVFSDLSKEIAEVCLSARTSCVDTIASLSALDDSFRRAVDSEERRLVEKRSFIDSARLETTEAVKRLAADMSHNAARPPDVRSAAAGLGRDVDRALLVVKAQDTLAHRLDRACAGLLAAAEACSEGSKGLLGRHAGELRSIAEDTSGVDREIAHISGGLQAHLRNLESGVANAAADSIDRAVRALQDRFTQTRSLLSDASATIRGVQELIAPLESSTGKAGSSVRQISALMKLIALNGQIHAIKIGNGTGLEVLAAHTSAISVATTEIGIATGEVSAKLAELVRSTLNRTAELTTAFEATDTWMTEEAGAAEELLHGFQASVDEEKRELALAFRQAREAADYVAVPAGQTELHDMLGDLCEATLQLEAIVDHGNRKPEWHSGFANFGATGKRLIKQTMWKDWSGREDSNLRPPGPEPGALPG